MRLTQTRARERRAADGPARRTTAVRAARALARGPDRRPEASAGSLRAGPRGRPAPSVSRSPRRARALPAPRSKDAPWRAFALGGSRARRRVLTDSSLRSIASRRARQPGRSPRASAIRASSLSITNVAALAPMLANRSRARERSASATVMLPRSASSPPRLRSSCASQNVSCLRRSVRSAWSVPASDWVESPAYHSTPIRNTSDRARSCGSSDARARSSSRRAALILPRSARSIARRRRASAVRRVRPWCVPIRIAARMSRIALGSPSSWRA